MFWQIHSFPSCTHHVFLSHSREDHDDLVLPVYRRLKDCGIASWIDRHDYRYGPDSRAALQNGILTCRHTVFFITEQLVANSRGWCVLELAYSEILQDNLSWGGSWSNVILPLSFVPRDHPGSSRSVWRKIQDRGPYFEKSKSEDRVEWAVARIRDFLGREEIESDRIRSVFRKDKAFKSAIPDKPGLRSRVSRFDPQSLKPIDAEEK